MNDTMVFARFHEAMDELIKMAKDEHWSHQRILNYVLSILKLYEY